MAQIAKVVSLTGKAFVVDPDGQLRALKVGDQIQKGEVIRTAQDARVELMMADGKIVALAPESNVRMDESMVQADSRPAAQESAVQTATVEAVIQALDRGQDLNQTIDPAAAGADGGGESGGDATFVRLLRIVEPVDPLAYNYTLSPLPTVQTITPAALPQTTDLPVINVAVTPKELPAGSDGVIAVTPDVIQGSVSGMQVIEGSGGGSRVVNFLFTLDKPSATDITITYIVRPGSATMGGDINDSGAGTPVTITIPAGANGFVVPVSVTKDGSTEGNETFKIELLSANGATLGNTTAEVTIVDDDIALAPATTQVDETGGLDSVTGNLNVDYKGAGTTPVVELSAEGATWVAGTKTLTDNGGFWQAVVNDNGTYTFTQLKAMSHTNAANPDDALQINIKATVTTSVVVNGETTTSTATGDIVINIRDDGPDAQVVSSNAPASQALALDETNLTGASIATSATSFSGHFVSGAAIYGTDGAATSGAITYSLSLSGTGTFNSGFQTLAGDNIVLSRNAETGAIEGKQGTATYFSITVNNSGEVVFTQYDNVKHATTTDHDDSDSLSLADGQAIVLTQTVKDADGDTDSASVNLVGTNSVASFTIDDDGPDAQVVSSNAPASQALALDETNLTGASIATSATSFSGHFVSGAAIYGTDGAATSGAITYSLSLSGTGTFNSGLQTLAGDNIVLSRNAETGAIEGKQGTATYFSITVNNSGEVVFTQYDNVKHATTTDHDDSDSLSLADGQAIVLTQTVKDADGDTDSASVNLVGTNSVASFTIDDDGPDAQVVSSNAPASQALALDETNLTGASIATSATSFSGHFVSGAAIYGTDGAATSGAITYSLSLSGTGTFNSGFQTLAGDNIVLSRNAETGAIEGKQGTATYFSITVNNSGEVVFTQYDNVKHATTTDHDDSDSLSLADGQAIVLTQTVKDADGDTDSASVNLVGTNSVASFTIDDDGPDAQVVSSNAPASQALALDETNLTGASIATSATSFSGHFVSGAAIYGTDGAATSGAITYSLSLSGTGTFNSGFQTLAGDNIVLSRNAETGAIEGKQGTATYFSITVNNSGEVVFTQYDNVKHATTTDHDDSDSLSLADGQAIVLTQTVKDADGDTDSASVNLVGTNSVASFTIDDDGPDAQVVSSNAPASQALALDETNLTGASIATSATSFSGHFVSGAAIYGTDGAATSGAITYSLSLSGTGTFNSGFQTLAGDNIVLSRNAETGAIEGKQGTATYFSITVNNSGEVVFTQYDNVKHATTTDHDDSDSLSLADGQAIVLTQTVKDADGDTDSASVNLVGTNSVASFTIDDDGPDAQVVSSNAPASQALALDETNLTGASIATSATSFSGHFVSGAAIYGTDGAATSGAITYSLSLSGTGTFNSGFQTLAGDNIVLSRNAETGAIEGKQGTATYFSITVNNSGEVVFTQYDNVKHATTTDHDDSDSLSLADGQAIVLTQTVKDADGDTDSASVNLVGTNSVASFTIDDDGPDAQVVSSNAPASQALALDETNLTGASIATSATSFSGHFVSGAAIYGTDGAATSGAITYSLSLSGTGTFNSGFQTLAGDNIVLSRNAETGAIEGKQGTATYFSITVNNSGEVVFTQYDNVKHATTTDHDDSDSLSLADGQAIVLTQTVKDADGDTDSASVNLVGTNSVASFTIDDDGPDAQVVSSNAPASQALALDETNLTGASIATSATSFSGHFVSGAAIYGTDGAATSGAITYSLSLSGTGTFNSGFQTLAGDNIVLSRNAETGAIEGKQGTATYFSITVNNSGEVVFTQYDNVKHATTTDHDDSDSLSLADGQAIVLTQTVKDADGDTDSASVNLVGTNSVASFTIDDDGPDAQVVSSNAPASQALALDETNLTGASIATSATSFSGHFVSGAAIYGTDGAATSGAITYSLSLSGTGTFNSGFQTLAGDNIVLSRNAETGAIEGKQGTATYFSITVNNSGEVVFTQYDNVKHATTTDHDDSDSLSLADGQAIVLTQTVKDADGDTDSASVNLVGTNSVASFTIDDDGPTVSVSATTDTAKLAGLALNLDETQGADDRYASGEAADTAVSDDLSANIARQTTSITGGLNSLFTIAATTGADGGTVVTDGTLSLQLAGASAGKVATTLTTVDGGAVSLSMSGSSVVGTDTNNDTVLTIAIVDVGTGGAHEYQLQVTLKEALNHGTDGTTAFDEVLTLLTSGTGTALQLKYTVTQVDADGDSVTNSDTVDIANTSAGALSFDDDGPTLSATSPSSFASNLKTGSTSDPVGGTYIFDDGADSATWGQSFNTPSALEWKSMPQTGGYSFTQTDSTWAGGDHTLAWTAKNGSTELFRIALNDNGTYQFQLLSGATPAVSSTISNLLTTVTNSSGPIADYTFGANLFGGAFELRVDGVSGTTDTDITISASALGGSGNTFNTTGNNAEKLILDVQQQAGFANASIAKIYLSIHDSASMKAGDGFTYVIHYASGLTVTSNETIPLDAVTGGTNPGIVVFDDFVLGQVVDFIEVYSDKGTWKVDGVSVDYYKDASVTDQKYEFTLTGTDADGDSSSSDFTVQVAAGTSLNESLFGGMGNDSIHGAAGDDAIAGMTGDDKLYGDAGNDTLAGGDGADVFKWSLSDQGSTTTPAVDHITDCSLAQNDVLNIGDLLQGESGTTSVNNLGQFLNFGLVDGKLALLVDHDGSGIVNSVDKGAFAATQKIVLDNYAGTGATDADKLASAKASFAAALFADSLVHTDADILNKMLQTGALKTDI